MTAGIPDISPLYRNIPDALSLLGKLSVTSQFKLSLHLNQTGTGGSGVESHIERAGLLDNSDGVNKQELYDILCCDASLPGLSFNILQEAGSYQGIVESFPSQKIFPPLDVSFYVDSEFKVIRLFEEWMNYISPLYSEAGRTEPNPIGMGAFKDRNSIFRLRYPEDYKRIISITKFERNFRVYGTNKLRQPPSVTYRLLGAFPTSVNSIPVTYEGSVITKTTVNFAYSRYVMEVNRGENNDLPIL